MTFLEVVRFSKGFALSLGELDLIITMGPILLVVLLEFANICLPAEVSSIDGGDQKVHLVGSNMVVMWVRSLVVGSWSWLVETNIRRQLKHLRDER